MQNTRFGAILKAYIIDQYYECCVTQPLILSSLHEFGVDISSGQINAILTQDKDKFHDEKAEILSKGIELSEELRTDDTGARHKFKNGYCNCINSDIFTIFNTTYSKSRINFLNILQQGNDSYHITKASLLYMQQASGTTKRYYTILIESYNRGERQIKDESTLELYFQ